MNRSDALEFICTSVREVFENAVESGIYNVYSKSEFDEVTSIDYFIEEKLIAAIKEYDPNAVFISEEYNSKVKLDGDVWIIDPIDGTCNLTHNIKTYGVQCAICESGKPVVAAVYFPHTQEMFTAIDGQGAYLNGAPIKCVERPVEKSLVSFGDFMRDDAAFDLEHRIMKHVAKKVERIRMYGAASVDFCYSACGRLDGNFTFTNNKWDIVPGLLICKEAGMIICDVYGQPYTMDSDTVAVFSSEKLFDSVMEWQTVKTTEQY